MNSANLLLESYQSATQGWLPAAMAAGHTLFLQLAALEVVVFGLSSALLARGGGAESMLPRLVWKLFMIALFLTGLLSYELWLPRIIPSFMEVAGEIAGFQTLNPMRLLTQGMTLVLLMITRALEGAFVLPLMLSAMVLSLSAFGVLLAFAAIAAQLIKTVIESWIVLSVGPFFLAFAPWRPTATLADNFVVYAVGVAIRMFFLVVMMSVAHEVVAIWIGEILGAGVFHLGTVFQIFLGSVLLAVTLWTIPARIADTLTRGWSLGLKEGLAA